MAEAEDNDGWQEAGRGGGGRRATAVRWLRLHGKVMELEQVGQTGCVGGVFINFSFPGRVESYLNPTLYNL